MPITPDAATEVRTALAQINAAWREGRPYDMAPLLDEHVVMVIPGFVARVTGRAALIESFVRFGTEARVHELREAEVHVDGGETVGIVQTRFEMVYEREGARWRSTGWDVWVFERRDEGWIAVWRTMAGIAEQPA